MAMNRSVFFDAVRHGPFPGRLTVGQVEGLTAIIEAAPRHGVTDVRWLAYILATTYHETAATMQPIKEHGGDAYFHGMYDMNGNRPQVARALGNTQPGDGARFAGRGYVQITGRTNYARAGKLLGVDLTARPDLAMEPRHAVPILFTGMIEGWFTGKALKHYFAPGVDDPVNARRIVNGTDKAAQIAGYHRQFLSALKKAGWAYSVPPPDRATPSQPSTEPGLFARLFSWLSGLLKGD